MEPKSDVHYLDNLEATELRLGLPGSNAPNSSPNKGNKRALEVTSTTGSSNTEECTSLDPTPPVKALVVGWPPVQSFRRNSFNARRGKEEEDAIKVNGGCGNRVGTGVLKVKVGMDGAPYLRKIDLMMYKGYKELRLALADMFKGFSIGENTITYEDKDGDWMLVGDVPWEMFTSSCNKLRIMRST